jgi:hypothetical protein
MNVIDRIIEKNGALWELLTNSNVTRAEALALINKAFPPHLEHHYQAGSTERLQAERITIESAPSPPKEAR